MSRRVLEVLASDRLTHAEWAAIWSEIYALESETRAPQCGPGQVGVHWPPESLIGFELIRRGATEIRILKLVRVVAS